VILRKAKQDAIFVRGLKMSCRPSVRALRATAPDLQRSRRASSRLSTMTISPYAAPGNLRTAKIDWSGLSPFNCDLIDDHDNSHSMDDRVSSVRRILDGKAPQDAPVTVKGWVRTRRDSKAGISFVHLSDGSSFHPVQVVATLNCACATAIGWPCDWIAKRCC